MKLNYLLESIARSIAYDKTLKTKYILMMKKKNNNRNKWLGADSIKKEIKCHRSATKIVFFERKKKIKRAGATFNHFSHVERWIIADVMWIILRRWRVDFLKHRQTKLHFYGHQHNIIIGTMNLDLIETFFFVIIHFVLSSLSNFLFCFYFCQFYGYKTEKLEHGQT